MSKAADPGYSLTEQDIVNFVENAKNHVPRRRTLVAPNAEIAKHWSKQYPDCDILLSAGMLSPNQRRTK